MTTTSAKSDWSGTFKLPDLLEITRRVSAAPPPISGLVLTPKQVAALREYAGPEFFDGPQFSNLSGIPIRMSDIVVDEFAAGRVRSGKIIQHDRFAEYEAADMVWAEPLGLAEWETVDREQVVFGISQRMSELLEFSLLDPAKERHGLFA